MIKTTLTLLIILFSACALRGKILINELVTGTTSDWVELKLAGNGNEKMDISSLFVTMYYGSNEKLADEPVTIYAADREETPYDDRFVVVHLTQPGVPDETDRTGDTNHNGVIDLYCGNYYGSLWNSDGVVAVDTDDDPSNGGILDFVAYSSRDGEANTVIASYAENAVAAGEWQDCSETGFQECSAYIGPEGLSGYQSLSRKNGTDTDSPDDFTVTRFQTPGRENVPDSEVSSRGIFRLRKKKILIIPSHPGREKGEVPISVNIPCSLKLRVFSLTGLLLYRSPLFREVSPGNFVMEWDPLRRNRKIPTGLYIGELTGVSRERKKSQQKRFYFIISRYR